MPGEITPIEAAREFGRDYETIMRYCRQSLVPAVKSNGRGRIDRAGSPAGAQAHGWLERPYGHGGRTSRVRRVILKLLQEASASFAEVSWWGRGIALQEAACMVCGDILGHSYQDGRCLCCRNLEPPEPEHVLHPAS